MLAESPHRSPNPVMVELFSRLEAQGVEVTRGYAGGGEAPDADLYLFKSRSPRWFDLAARLDAQGRRLVGSWPARQLVRDKWACTERLREAGVPVPQTWRLTDERHVSELLETRAVVVKPRVGGAGVGVQLLERGARDWVWPGSVDSLVQERVPTSRPDLKLYVVGDAVFGARKTFAPGSGPRPGEPCAVEPAHHALAQAVVRAVGADLLGIDLVEGPNGPVVVDVNWFPAYRAFRDAAVVLARWASRQLAEAVSARRA